MGAPYIYDISRLRVKDLHSATYIYVVRRLRVNGMDSKLDKRMRMAGGKKTMGVVGKRGVGSPQLRCTARLKSNKPCG